MMHTEKKKLAAAFVGGAERPTPPVDYLEVDAASSSNAPAAAAGAG